MTLKNVIMQLRKVCQHPYLFHWPKDPLTREPILNEELVTSSGKMMVLDRLLDALFAEDHKVLLFSQFTTMLDIIQVCFSNPSFQVQANPQPCAGLGDGVQGVARVPP